MKCVVGFKEINSVMEEEKEHKCYGKVVVFALTLIRHGETGANKDNIIQGQMDVPLSETGFKQANLLGERLRNQQYTHIFASDLVRAQQTVQTIVDKSHLAKCDIIRDERLRERKFGEVEGKSIVELKKLARSANQLMSNFTPLGAETVQQVRNRAVLFFQELCQQLLQVSGTLNGLEQQQQQQQQTGTSGVKRRRQSSVCADESSDNKAKTACLKVGKGAAEDEVEATTMDETNSESNYRKVIDDSPKLSPQLCVYVPSRRHALGRNGAKIQSSVTVETNCAFAKHASTFMDTDCPNVSLSPLGEHKFLNVSSGLSDRKASVDSLNDDGDLVTRPAANVLVVSHGGLLREMVRYFVEDLGCCIPGGKGQALRLSPNTGLSKFTVSITDLAENPKIICLLIHDKDHLVGNGISTVNSTAL